MKLSKPSDRFEIVNHGPRKWVLVDNESDDPAEVYSSAEAAEAAKARKIVR